jgi:hypothetical protein
MKNRRIKRVRSDSQPGGQPFPIAFNEQTIASACDESRLFCSRHCRLLLIIFFARATRDWLIATTAKTISAG